MKFRPCIDIHDGKVKQIQGASLSDLSGTVSAVENFVSTMTAADYALMYKERGLLGGHGIILNKQGTPEYEASKKELLLALSAFPNGLQVGGGINDGNAMEFIDAMASHVIVTSFVFFDGRIDMERLKLISKAVGPHRLVLDLSVKLIEGEYHVVTDRWQRVSKEVLDLDLLNALSKYCDEYLVHAADVEGKKSGVDDRLISMLSGFRERPVTYAGGISSMKDLELIKTLGEERIDFTVGSALDIFGGTLEFNKVCKI